MPLGLLGELAYYFFVKQSLTEIFDFRSRELTAIMGR
jgi:hypothetical protein